MAFNITPFKSTDDFTMAGFNGKIQEINNGVGAYANEYWWRRRVPKTTGYIEKVATQGSTFLVQYNVTPVTYTYGDLSIDQSTGAVSISNAQTITLNINSSVSDFYVLVGKYFTPDKTVSQSWGGVKTLTAGEIYRITDSNYIKYYSDEDSTYVYSQYIDVITSIYSAGEPGDWQYIHSPNRNAYPDSGTQDGYEYEYLGIPFDNAVNGVKIETGSYVGTGKYGAANPNTLTFGFTPKMVFMTDGANSFDARYTLFFPWLESITSLNIDRPNQDRYALRTTISGNTISCFNGTSADFQWNTANHKYCYLVIG